jgi:cytidylate kinase
MINIEDFVRKQIALYRAYDIRAEKFQRAGRGEQGKVSFGPYLLISREKGAGGSAVGQLAGERLGWQVFDKQIVDAIAAKANVRRELIESLDERDRKRIRRIVHEFLYPATFKHADYLATFWEIVIALGHQGDVVMVGRGAHQILPTQFGLRVRMVAPMEVRVRRIANENKMTLKAAQIEVEKSDRERARLTRRYYHRDLNRPLNYDMIINTAELSVEVAAEIVVAAVRQKLAVRLKGSG